MRPHLLPNSDFRNCVDITPVGVSFQAQSDWLKPPEKVFWGGYFADPDGHVWDVAYNPFWPLDEEGYLCYSED